MRFEDVSSTEDFEEFFFREKEFGYIDEETFWIDKEHKARYYFVDNLNYRTAYKLYRKKKGSEMTPYYIFVDSTFDTYYIFSDYHTPFKFIYDRNRRERDYTKKSRRQLLNALRYEDKSYNDTFQALFDTKPLVKKFYEEYGSIKERLSAALTGLNGEEKWFYSQVILDRIIFIYFLQSRGIIKKDYLSNLFRNRDREKNFLKNYLEPLFFNAFNTEHRFYENVIGNGIDLGNIPYLNGGLFSRKGVENDNEITVKDSIWGDIFKLFDSYEWVVEDRYKDAIVLTPSILGHIFEQSITGRKGKGAYYTPAEITDYISMNTIYPYIRDRLNERFGTEYKNIIFELLDRDGLSENEIDKIAYLYFNVLKELRVLDNACGSGAFLMAAHRILLALYRKCYKILKDKMVFSAENKAIESYGSSDYYFKRLIATQNIYGVDLEEGAVEIAKLRLWLSMISDLSIESVEPLPNIDYNIMHGNSLIGFVEAPLEEQTALDSSDTTKQIIKAKGILLNNYKATTDPNEAERLRKDIERINEKFRKELNEKFHLMLTVDYKIKISKEELEALRPFHWGFEFYEVFDLDKPKGERGFDVVVGNPPYISKQLSKIGRRIYKMIYYESISDRPNIYNYFINRISNLLSTNGFFSFITSNSFITDQFSNKLRKFILKTFIIEHIVDFLSRNNVFKGILQGTCIFIFKKASPLEMDEYNIKITQTFDSNSLKNSNIESATILKRNLTENRYNVFLLSPYNETYKIISKVESNTNCLGNVSKIIQSGEIRPADSNCRPFFIKGYLDNMVNKENISPVVTGKNINCFIVDATETRKDPRWYRRPAKKEKLLSRDEHSTYPRIVLQRITAREQSRRLCAGLIDKSDIEKYGRIWIENSGLNYILLGDEYHNFEYEPNFLIGLLSSIFVNWYIHHMNITAAISPSDIKMIPVPIITPKNKKLIELVNHNVKEITRETKKLESTEEILQHIFPTFTKVTEITEIMEKIDDLIFNLYEISPKEKKFILKQVENHYNYFNPKKTPPRVKVVGEE